MTAQSPFKNDFDRPSGSRYGIVLSIALHIVIFGILFLFTHRLFTTEIVAAGPGEGGEGGGGSIEVGVADQSAILGFAKPQPVSYVGDKDDAINNAKVETARREEDSAEDVLPRTEKDAPDPKALKTDRPVVDQQEKIFTGKEERGRSDNPTAQVGRTYGTPSPAMIGGVGIGSGGGFGGGTGLARRLGIRAAHSDDFQSQLQPGSRRRGKRSNRNYRASRIARRKDTLDFKRARRAFGHQAESRQTIWSTVRQNEPL